MMRDPPALPFQFTQPVKPNVTTLVHQVNRGPYLLLPPPPINAASIDQHRVGDLLRAHLRNDIVPVTLLFGLRV